MTTSSLDLVYELLLEFGWDSTFAAAAKREYIRWLRLRAKTQDFEQCKLPPSRVVAMVWNLHRQWTLDYTNLCNSFGGFIHHYPPAMRVNVAMEQAYNMTLQMYRNEYKEDPPTEYWGPSVCINGTGGRGPIDPSLIPGSHFPTGNMPTVTIPNVRPGPGRPKKRGPKTAAEKNSTNLLVVGATTSAAGRPAASTTSPNRPAGSPGRNPRGGTSRVDKSLMLRPLAPGEKRRRGRPSATEYMPIGQMGAASPQTTPKSPGRVGRPRRVKTVPTKPADASSIEKVILEVTEQADQPFRPAASIAPRPADGASTVAATPQEQPGGQAAIASDVPPAPGSVPLKGARIPFRRPRGRPRKDGSWPRPRTPQGTPVRKQPAAPSGQLAAGPVPGTAKVASVMEGTITEGVTNTSKSVDVVMAPAQTGMGKMDGEVSMRPPEMDQPVAPAETPIGDLMNPPMPIPGVPDVMQATNM